MNFDRNLHVLSKEQQGGAIKGEKVVFRKCNNCPHTVWHVVENSTVYCGCNIYHQHYQGDTHQICPCTWKIEGHVDTLKTAEKLISNGHFQGHHGPELKNNTEGRAVMQGDGNFVIYWRDRPKWASNTCNVGAGPYELALLNDGNLVLLDSNGNAIWNAGVHTQHIREHPAKLVMQDDGNLVVYDNVGTPVWASGTCGQMHE